MSNPWDFRTLSSRATGRRTAAVLTLAGALAFWLCNLAISTTAIAAEYRHARSIPYAPMLIEAFVGGLVIAFAMSIVLVRFFRRVPGKGALQKSMVLSLVVVLVVTVAIELPSTVAADLPDTMGCLAAGLVLNSLRVLAMGLSVGLTYRKLGAP